jgi:pyruvate formate lyase activating enzyme
MTQAPQILHNPNGDRLAGRVYTAGELAEMLNRQAPLLRSGGVSFSGGEPLMQAAFLAEVIDRLDGIHVVLGTSGFAPEMDFRQVVSRCDLVLFDLKLVDPVAHRHWTGVSPEPIHRNLAMLAGLGIPFIVRVPLVPGVTDTEANLRAIARLVRSLPCPPRVELLPYNRAAGGKYAACGLTWRPEFDETTGWKADLTPFHELRLEVSIL